tara:strand:+ start:879 stop:1379 length:501 start_codon:yes stop_codon:yes gene_type:complete
MRFLLFFLVFLFSCSSLNSEKTKKIYICGDHPCANKKEVKNYFDNNISIEVYTVTTKKKRDRDFDLVQLNMSKEEKDKYVSLVEKEKDIKKKLKNRKKIEKINIKNEKKVKKIAKRTESKKKRKKKRSPNLTLVRLCKNLEECDIDDVAKIILDMSKKKKFPDITE